MNIQCIGVVGAGVMGCGVALNLASYGYHIVLHDLNPDILDTAKHNIMRQHREIQLFRQDLPIKDLSQLLISYTHQYERFSDVDFIIENIDESIAAKQALFKVLPSYCRENVIYAINTSCIPITELASLCPRPEKVLGMHFMNPVPLKPFVEMIRGFHTNEATLEAAKQLLTSINKSYVVVNDMPGFVSNRLSHLFMNEAAFLVYERVAEPADIDKVFKLGYGHKMGPLETADLIGIDTVVNSLNVLYQQYEDSKFRCCPLLKQMVASGRLGRKNGKGFFHY